MKKKLLRIALVFLSMSCFFAFSCDGLADVLDNGGKEEQEQTVPEPETGADPEPEAEPEPEEGEQQPQEEETPVSAAIEAQRIFDRFKGQRAPTNGWADMYNNGEGLLYAKAASVTVIDNETYPNAVERRKAFTDAVSSDTEKFIVISGDIDLSDGVISDSDKSYFDEFYDAGGSEKNGTKDAYKRKHGDIKFKIGSNTTIIGVNDARLMFGGMEINNEKNIIIRNITFYDAHGSTEEDTTSSGNSSSKAGIDALVVQGDSSGIWVDHCGFTDGTCNDMIRNYHHDGAFDIPKGKNITVSWCEFTNHDKVMLVAGSDSESNAIAEDRQITLHHNYFHKTTQRMPRTRGTQMHIYNNYYNDIGVSGNNGSFMGPGWGAQFIVENNFFGSKLGSKNIEWMDSAAYPAKVYYTGNNKDTTAFWTRASAGDKPWTPAYEYEPEDNAGLPTSIPAGAGPRLDFEV